jgi:hypothetical protein
MAGKIQFSERQAQENAAGAEEWRDKHNKENPDTTARFDVLTNGNVRLYVEAKDKERAIREQMARS